MREKNVKLYITLGSMAVLLMGLMCCGNGNADKASDKITITNVSYDPTREFYLKYNEAFENYYKETYGKEVEVVQSHGGSSTQARSVIEGADADVVTLASERDIDLIQKAGLIEENWRDEFKENSAPYTSTIVFLVRKGNEKEIKDWDDLTKKGVEVITPDPKSSGGACWNFMAAWNYAVKKYQDEEKEKQFLADLYGNVSVLDSGARGATTTFVENGQGDVLIAWENEAIATRNEYPDEYEIVYPSVSILAQPSVAIVDENVDRYDKRAVSEEYLNYLYSNEAQHLIAESGYRPSDSEVLAQYADQFNLDMELCTIDDFGGWDNVYEKFFADGGIFDEIYLEY